MMRKQARCVTYKKRPYFFAQMPAALTALTAQVPIDKALKTKLREMNRNETWAEVAARINEHGFTLSARNIEHILTHRRTVPYPLYIEIVGKEPERIFWKEPPGLAQRMAFWHCYFFDVGRHELAGRVAVELQKGGLNYSATTINHSLFTTEKKGVDTRITDAVAQIFMTAAGEARFSSLDEVKEFLVYLDRNNNGGRHPAKVTWPEVEPVVYALQRLTGASFRKLLGGRSRNYYASSRGYVKAGRLAQLQKQLQELPQYRLVQLLGYAVKVLQTSELPGAKVENVSLLAELSDAERRLLARGSHNYGAAAFATHVLPPYAAIRREHKFPVEELEFLVDFPAAQAREREKRGNRAYAVEGKASEALSANVGKRLWWYKQRVLDVNKEKSFNFGVTRDGLEARLTEASREARDYLQMLHV